MAKPLRYGPTIGVRLPLEIHDAVIEMAGPEGPGPWIRDLVITYAVTEGRDQITTDHTIAGYVAEAGPGHIELVCQHLRATQRIIGGGLKNLTCPDCGATKTGKGDWTPA